LNCTFMKTGNYISILGFPDSGGAYSKMYFTTTPAAVSPYTYKSATFGANDFYEYAVFTAAPTGSIVTQSSIKCLKVITAALQYYGGQYILGRAAESNTTTYKLSCLITGDATPAGVGGVKYIGFSSADNTPSADAIGIQINTSGNYTIQTYNNTTENNYALTVGGSSISVLTWHYVTMTLQNTTFTVTIDGSAASFSTPSIRAPESWAGATATGINAGFVMITPANTATTLYIGGMNFQTE
jgi:hypothetical protein